jgi:hypothetical protein
MLMAHVLLCCAEAVRMSGGGVLQAVHGPQLAEEAREEPHSQGASTGAQEGTVRGADMSEQSALIFTCQRC